ncbi:MAG: PilZ domain-containing protein [Betaproteobacteria bacterium]|nr:MAG: PilZ domain-containing protein [Betaproteobacteria bacterium]
MDHAMSRLVSWPRMKPVERRRGSSRYPLRWKAAVVFDGAQNKPIVHTRTQDLSVVGAAILSDHGDLTGSFVTLLLAYPARKGDERPKVLKVRAQVVSTVRTPGMSHYRHGLSFISAPDDGLDVLAEILSAAKVQEAAPAPPAAGSRLAQLRQLAQAKSAEGISVDPQEVINAFVSDALVKAYRYLKELAEQLNILHPAFPRGYAIAGVPEFTGLAWKEGHANFHTREVSPAVKLYREVSLRFQLAGEKPVRVVREFPAGEKLKQLLEDSRIEFNANDTWNKRGSIERTTFDFPCEVKAYLMLLGQFDSGKLLLRARNVSGFGSMEQIVTPEAVNDDALDELAAFILGETGRLGPLLLRGA